MFLTRARRITSWIAQIAAAVILFQTLFFKFTGAPESVYIFSTLGVEPWGRIGSGVLELITSVLLVVPATAAVGAVLAIGLMGGAIMSHVAILGIAVMDDGGELFALAVIVLVCAAIVAYLRRDELPFVNLGRGGVHVRS
jgi:hypothetical protein